MIQVIIDNIAKEVVSFNFTGFQILFLCWISDVLSLISVGFQTFFFEFCLISDVAFFFYFVGFQTLFLKILLDFSCFSLNFVRYHFKFFFLLDSRYCFSKFSRLTISFIYVLLTYILVKLAFYLLVFTMLLYYEVKEINDDEQL
jgi:hypothetical protein